MNRGRRLNDAFQSGTGVPPVAVSFPGRLKWDRRPRLSPFPSLSHESDDKRDACPTRGDKRDICLAALGLILAATAGAAPAPKKEFKPELQHSSYEPTKTRDPFAKAGGELSAAVTGPARAVSGEQFAFRLEGILHDPADPAAVINDKLVRLNKTVTFTSASGAIPVKLVEIGRGRVVIEAGGQKVELWLASAPGKTKAEP